MKRVRVIPMLLLDIQKVVKTVQFKNPIYVGDPINILRIFNEKEVDEICVADIRASENNQGPDLPFIRSLTSECFMPLSYGGGISSVRQAEELFRAGVEKVVIGAACLRNPSLIDQIVKLAGSQSVTVSIDVKKKMFGGERVFINNGKVNTNFSPTDFARQMESRGAGEILLQDIDREGSMAGYNIQLVKKVSESVGIPVIASGGCSKTTDFLQAIQAGASAVAAGAMFVYKGPHKAVLVNYPSQETLNENLYSKL